MEYAGKAHVRPWHIHSYLRCFFSDQHQKLYVSKGQNANRDDNPDNRVEDGVVEQLVVEGAHTQVHEKVLNKNNGSILPLSCVLKKMRNAVYCTGN